MGLKAEVRVHRRIAEIGRGAWDRCARAPGEPFNPFVAHAFLDALEESGCAAEEAGWAPHHLAIEDQSGAVGAVMPLYLKSHSQGEYVFDHAWADAFERAGGRYYPKLTAASPFSPVTGPRLLVREDLDRRAGRGQRGRTHEELGRQIVGQALDDAVLVLDQHPPGDRDCEARDRAVDVEHVGDVAIAVAPFAKLGIAVDVDPPVEHRLSSEAGRRHPQQLDHAPRRLGIAVGRGVVDEELHQPNRNWRAIAWSIAALSRI